MRKFPVLELNVPTYVGEQQRATRADYAEPHVPVLVYEDRGVRIVLGTHERQALAPDMQIERRPHGWAIFLNPMPGSDPSALVYFHDDRRSWISKLAGGPTPVLIEVDDVPPEIDQ